MRVLPSPFTRVQRGRYGYRLSVRQLEMSDTRVFDRPQASSRDLVDHRRLVDRRR